ncbi:hypothetical protein CERSUDRAFT_92243 [Gelatoporia subvermispora B]|uniref:C3H1-type domain-containing protein n=1 Tax=Ceriporiopsis subvermispora (strain B) TaxID=914234 RepID=M2PSU6_CERS8|nr:hypothetical protein CERSUDRAFT_92243 [Gelatoporia subvermispora B]
MSNQVAINAAVDAALRAVADRATSPPARIPCNFYRAGYCQNGSVCAFAHEVPPVATSSRLSPLPLPFPPAQVHPHWAGPSHAPAYPPLAAPPPPFLAVPPTPYGYTRPPASFVAPPPIAPFTRPMYLPPRPAAPAPMTPAAGVPAGAAPPLRREPSHAVARMPREEQEGRKASFRYKEEPCMFWEQRGSCRKGANCTYRHETRSRLARIRQPPAKLPADEETSGFRPVSWRVVSGGVTFGGQRKVCHRFVAGWCSDGLDCPLLHPGQVEDEHEESEVAYSAFLWRYLPPGFASAVPLPLWLPAAPSPTDDPSPAPSPFGHLPPHPTSGTWYDGEEDWEEDEVPQVTSVGPSSPSLLVRPVSTPPESSTPAVDIMQLFAAESP